MNTFFLIEATGGGGNYDGIVLFFAAIMFEDMLECGETILSEPSVIAVQIERESEHDDLHYADAYRRHEHNLPCYLSVLKVFEHDSSNAGRDERSHQTETCSE